MTASSITRAEIASQPDLWERAIALGRSGVPGLPEPGERVLLLGCGTSYYVAAAIAWLREAAGHGVTDAVVADELPPRLRGYDRVIAISRSGTSSDLLDAVHTVHAGEPEPTVVAILGEQGTPLAELAEVVVDFSFADEQSVVQTRFPTSQLIMFLARLGHPVDHLPGLARKALAGPLPDHDIRQLVVLGRGWGVAVANEAALKVRESAGAWAEAYPVGEYRHGPVACCDRGTLVWCLDRLPEDIVDAVVAAGGRVEHGSGEPLVELVRLHRFAVELATAAGRDADCPRNLTRSVVLTP